MGNDTSTDVVRTLSGFIQDKWSITKRFSFKPGLRYEMVRILWNNRVVKGGSAGSYINTDYKDYVPGHYNELIPKAFASYELDDIAGWLKDTSVSMGVSKIWTPRATCEVCTWGSGVEMDPTEGYGVDLIFQRRVWKNIVVMLDFSHYDFDNYVVWADSSSDYFNDSPWMRRMVGLSDVTKDGFEMEVNGNITDKLSMNVSFAYVDWDYDGPKGGIEEMSAADLSDRAKFRFNIGLVYNFNERLHFNVNYRYQDKQEQDVITIIDEDTGEFDVNHVVVDSYGTMDASVSYRFLEKWYRLENPTIKVYVNNAMDADYENSSGYPATERTFGVSLSMTF